jgi:hypothetical protein
VSFFARVHPEQYSPDNHYTLLDKFHGPLCLGSSTGWTFTGKTDNRGLEFAYGNGGGYFGVGAAQLLDDQWHHLVGIADANQFHLYVDGELYASRALEGAPVGNDGSLYIGKWGCANSRFLHGAIDDLRLYNRVLSDEEIAALYDQSSPQDPPAEEPLPEEPEVCPAPVGDGALRPVSSADLVVDSLEINPETGKVEFKASLDPASAAWAELVRNPNVRITIEVQTESANGQNQYGLVGDATVPLMTDDNELRYGEKVNGKKSGYDKHPRHKKSYKRKEHHNAKLEKWLEKLERKMKRAQMKRLKMEQKN